MQVIYSMYWEKSEKHYIGKTDSLKRRSKEHLNLLKSGNHYNFKLQKAYNDFGEPKISILETCEDDEVFLKESYWITKYNSVQNGYNLIGGSLNCEPISESVDSLPIPDPTIECKFILIDSQNKLHYINNTNEFCRTNPDLSATWESSAGEINRVKRGVAKSHKGYRLYDGINTIPLKKEYLYDVYKNEVFLCTIENIAEFCRKCPDLSDNWEDAANCLRAVVRGRRKQHKKYKLVKKLKE